MKTIVNLILIGTSIALFYFVTNKFYDQIKVVTAQTDDYKKALTKSLDVLNKRKSLQAEYAKFSNEDLKNIKKLLPDHVDNIQLILDIDSIARSKGMDLKSVRISDEKVSKDTTLGPTKSNYGSILVSFNVLTSYDNFLEFLGELEKSLRLVDVTSLSFKSNDKEVYDYSLTIRTYWLK